MTFDWKGLVRAVAPTIGAGLGNALLPGVGGVAGKLAMQAVSSALLGKPDAPEAEIIAALETATPDQLLALKAEDHKFAADMKKLDVDVFALENQDRDSARRREVDSHDSWTPRVLVAILNVGFFGTLGALFHYGVPEGGAHDAILTMLGALITAWLGGNAYYFGTTMGSKSSQATIAKIATGP